MDMRIYFFILFFRLAATAYLHRHHLIHGQAQHHDHVEGIHPCSLEDWNCIRSFLATNPNCRITHGPPTDSLLMPRLYVPMSSFNMSFELINLDITGLRNARISEFYQSKLTGNVVLSISFSPLIRPITDIIYKYERRAKESIVIYDIGNGTFPAVTFTAIIPKVPHLRLNKAEIQGYNDDPNPNFTYGPKVMGSTDPQVIRTNMLIMANGVMVAEENIMMQAPFILNRFIQSTLCDFGVLYGFTS